MVMRLMQVAAEVAAFMRMLSPALQKEIHECIKSVCRTRKEHYSDKGIIRIKENYYKIQIKHYRIYFHTDSKQFINIFEIKEIHK